MQTRKTKPDTSEVQLKKDNYDIQVNMIQVVLVLPSGGEGYEDVVATPY